MPVDEILKYLVQRAEDTWIGNSITLSVNGAIINGTIIRSKAYYEVMSTILDGKGRVLNKDKHYHKRWNDYKKEYKSFIETLKGRQSTQNEYLHLENARLLNSNRPYDYPLWRCKLSAIDGFSIGDYIEESLLIKRHKPKKKL